MNFCVCVLVKKGMSPSMCACVFFVPLLNLYWMQPSSHLNFKLLGFTLFFVVNHFENVFNAKV